MSAAADAVLGKGQEDAAHRVGLSRASVCSRVATIMRGSTMTGTTHDASANPSGAATQRDRMDIVGTLQGVGI